MVLSVAVTGDHINTRAAADKNSNLKLSLHKSNKVTLIA